MDNQIEALDIYVIVNYPRLNTLHEEPIEGLIRRQDGAIAHNVFGVSISYVVGRAEDWIRDNGYKIGQFYGEPAAHLYNDGFQNGWRMAKRPVSAG